LVTPVTECLWAIQKKNQKQLGKVKYWQLMQAEHKEGQWEASVQRPSAQ
jgi:hypothetical protein